VSAVSEQCAAVIRTNWIHGGQAVRRIDFCANDYCPAGIDD